MSKNNIENCISMDSLLSGVRIRVRIRTYKPNPEKEVGVLALFTGAPVTFLSDVQNLKKRHV